MVAGIDNSWGGGLLVNNWISNLPDNFGAQLFAGVSPGNIFSASASGYGGGFWGSDVLGKCVQASMSWGPRFSFGGGAMWRPVYNQAQGPVAGGAQTGTTAVDEDDNGAETTDDAGDGSDKAAATAETDKTGAAAGATPGVVAKAWNAKQEAAFKKLQAAMKAASTDGENFAAYKSQTPGVVQLTMKLPKGATKERYEQLYTWLKSSVKTAYEQQGLRVRLPAHHPPKDAAPPAK